jgi:hypothetical protein
MALALHPTQERVILHGVIGSTTFTRTDLARGFEPDACFYTYCISSFDPGFIT